MNTELSEEEKKLIEKTRRNERLNREHYIDYEFINSLLLDRYNKWREDEEREIKKQYKLFPKFVTPSPAIYGMKTIDTENWKWKNPAV